MLKEFKKQKWNNPHIKGYCRNQSTPKTDVLSDSIMMAVLKEIGFEAVEDAASIYDPQALYEALERFSPSKDTRINWDADWENAFNRTFKVFAKPKHLNYLKATMHVGTIRKALKMEKSSGLPAMTSKEEDFSYAYDRSTQVLRKLKRPSPCIAYVRTSHGMKTRLVWGYPLEMTILESVFARPLTDTFLERRTTMAFGLSNFTLGAYVSQIERAYGRTVSLDYSKFDSSISSFLINKAFKILGTWFSQEDKDEYGWEAIIDYFVYTPILMPNGNVYTGKNHGVPSGSYFTQMIDSVVNTMIQFYLASKLKYSLNWEKFLVLGDDVILSIPKEITLHRISDVLLEIGITMHPDKCREDAHFLGATWIMGIPYRDIDEILSRLVYTEKYRKYLSDTKIGRRHEAIGIILNMCSQYANAYRLIPRVLGFKFDAIEDTPLTYREDIQKTEGSTSYGAYRKEYLDKGKVKTDMLSARLLS